MPRQQHTQLHRLISGAIFTTLAWTTTTLRPAAADDAKLKAYGRHLAQECASCHRIDGVDNGNPSIVGWPTDTFITTIQFYRDGTRNNPVMVSVVNSLNDQQVDALAAFFTSLPKPPSKAGLPTEKVKK